MLPFTVGEYARLAGPRIVANFYAWIEARDRATGARVGFGFWDGAHDMIETVVDGRTGLATAREFSCKGLVSVGDLTRSADFTVQSTDVVLSAIDLISEQAARGYDLSSAPVQVYLGFRNPDTFALEAPPQAVFIGLIDEAPITTKLDEGVAGSTITLKCVTDMRDLARVGLDVRSDESQQARAQGDRFYRYTGVVGSWDVFWGKTRTVAKNLGGGSGCAT